MKPETKHRLRACLSLLLALVLLASPMSVAANAATYSTCTEAKETAEQAIEYGTIGKMMTDIIIDVLNSPDASQFQGSNSNFMVKIFAVSTIKDKLDDYKTLVESIGFTLDDTTKENLANELYDVACIYYDNGKNDNAAKLSIIEMIRYVLATLHNDKNAQANAENYYIIYTYAVANGDEAAIQAEIAKASGHSYGDWYTVEEATCSKSGQERRDCSSCGAYETKSISATNEHSDAANDGDHLCDTCKTENMSDHTGGTATCMAQAVCDDCKQSYGEVNTENHTGNNTVVGETKETCGENGYTGDTVCECGVTVEAGKPIPATGEHSFADDLDDTCDNCDYVREIVSDDEKDDQVLWGDADGNGTIDASDATVILQYCVNLISATDFNMSVCDLDDSGKVDAADATLILQYCVDLITKFPVE